jgi:hypothetical protein
MDGEVPVTQTWLFRASYGDRDERVVVQRHPDDLTAPVRAFLRDLYEGRIMHVEARYAPEYRSLELAGLVREIGDAWNKETCYAPFIHEWARKPVSDKPIARHRVSVY